MDALAHTQTCRWGVAGDVTWYGEVWCGVPTVPCCAVLCCGMLWYAVLCGGAAQCSAHHASGGGVACTRCPVIRSGRPDREQFAVSFILRDGHTVDMEVVCAVLCCAALCMTESGICIQREKPVPTAESPQTYLARGQPASVDGLLQSAHHQLLLAGRQPPLRKCQPPSADHQPQNPAPESRPIGTAHTE